MTISTLKNDKLTVQVSTLGAELQSIQTSDNTEYLWQGDKEFWARRAPVLFPIVGKLKDGKYRYDGREYELPGHGFARDQEFKLVKETHSELEYELRQNDETLLNYPFKFSLKIIYKLKNNDLHVTYEVKNLDEKVMFFSIGAHPAFNAPIENGSFEDYKIDILPAQIRKGIPLNPETGLLYLDQAKDTDKSELNLTRELFAKDAIIYETPGDTQVILSNDKDDRSVKVSYNDMPLTGIWSPYPSQAPFVCIEPWCGAADDSESDGDIETKFAINELFPDRKFKCSYTVEIN